MLNRATDPGSGHALRNQKLSGGCDYSPGGRGRARVSAREEGWPEPHTVYRSPSSRPGLRAGPPSPAPRTSVRGRRARARQAEDGWGSTGRGGAQRSGGSQERSTHPWGRPPAQDTGGPGDLAAVASGVCGAFGIILRAAGRWIGQGLRASFYPQDWSATWGQTEPAGGGVRTFRERN